MSLLISSSMGAASREITSNQKYLTMRYLICKICRLGHPSASHLLQ